MKANMGNTDRGIRLVAGLTLLIWAYWANNYLGLIGLVLIATAFIKWCPLYTPFKISTRHQDKRELS